MQKMHSRKLDLKLFMMVHSFNEFVVKLNKPVKEMNQMLLKKGYYWWL